MPTSPKTSEPWPQLFPHRRDQRTLVVLIVGAWCLLTVSWWWRGGCQGRLVDIDELPPRTAEFQVDLNRADWAELAALPDIGETLARRIVAWRAAHGPFREHDQLRQVKGIGRKKMDRVRPYLAPLEGPGVKVGS